MTKKLVCLLLIYTFIIFTIAGNTVEAAARTRIGVIVKTERFELEEQVKQKLFVDLKNLFPESSFQILQNQRLGEDLSKMLSGKLLKEPAQIQKEALLDLAKKYKYDCVLLLSYELETTANNNNFLDWQKNALVTLKARMIYQKTANYIYANDITRADSSKLKKLKDFSNISDVASLSSEKCNEHLFSQLELPLAKRTIELS